MTNQFKPKLGDRYFYVDSDGLSDGCVESRVWDNFRIDHNRMKIGNCFATKKETIAAAKRVKKALKGDAK